MTEPNRTRTFIVGFDSQFSVETQARPGRGSNRGGAILVGKSDAPARRCTHAITRSVGL